MAPASSTPNFSRPLVSPMSAELDTPVRARCRLAFGEPPHTAAAALMGMPKRQSLERGTPSKRLFNVPGSRNGRPAEKSGTSTQSFNEIEHVQILSDLNLTGNNGSQHPVKSADLGGQDKPISNFCRTSWPQLDRQRQVLIIDLFWPIELEENGGDGGNEEDDDDGDDQDKNIFPYAGLKPLVTFHNLHHLQITGMMRSYQQIIFATSWVNKSLTHLHLEMTIGPKMKPISRDTELRFRLITDDWSYDPASEEYKYCEYLGYHGEGVLHDEFGSGEYLDQQAIKMAQMSVGTAVSQENLHLLPITHLTLKNFVVDANPFFRWFDPNLLEEIVLKAGCVDAGFYLPPNMKTAIKVDAPKQLNVARRVKPGEIKHVKVKRWKETSRKNEGTVAGVLMIPNCMGITTGTDEEVSTGETRRAAN
ncbi:hypothetical protein LTR84_009411 [Exophiala bonariae]|uniref:Uncharacterized protein n=1 Tax=Exophiala bonariae TaxID=1690606 RepID=A0AAV9MXG6_9EURO|nr:hypothetical protein LTR84_009411 [Exophiala bonariae]